VAVEASAQASYTNGASFYTVYHIALDLAPTLLYDLCWYWYLVVGTYLLGGASAGGQQDANDGVVHAGGKQDVAQLP
jgi:hypothetical protein